MKRTSQKVGEVALLSCLHCHKLLSQRTSQLFAFLPRPSPCAYSLYDCLELQMPPAHKCIAKRTIFRNKMNCIVVARRTFCRSSPAGFHSTRRNTNSIRCNSISSCNINFLLIVILLAIGNDWNVTDNVDFSQDPHACQGA